MSFVSTATGARLLRVTATLLALIWLLGETAIVWPNQTIRMLAGVAMAAFMIPAIVLARRPTQLLALVLLSTAFALSVSYAAWPALWRGFERAVLLAALLPTLSLLRIALHQNLRIEAYRRKVGARTSAERPVWILSGSYVMASLLSLGAIPVIASLVPAGAQEDVRLRNARAGVCGASLPILWSPFFVALALVTEYVPEVPPGALIAGGLALSALGAVVALRVHGAGSSAHTLVDALRALGGFVVPIALATVALLAVRTVTGFSTIQSILVVLPVLCALLLATPPRRGITTIVPEMWSSLCRIQDEAAIVASAIVFGTVLTAVPWMEDVTTIRLIAGLPAAMLIFGCMAFMIVGGVFGLLPLVTGTIALVVLTGTTNALNDLAIGMSVLAGWSLASMASVSSMVVLVTAGQFEVRPERLVFGRNLGFLLVFVPLCGLAITLLSQIT